MSAQSHTVVGLAWRARLVVIDMTGTVGVLATGFAASWVYAPLVGWDGAALMCLCRAWLTIAPMTAKSAGQHVVLAMSNAGTPTEQNMVVIRSTALLSQLFGAVILASAINLVVGISSSR